MQAGTAGSAHHNPFTPAEGSPTGIQHDMDTFVQLTQRPLAAAAGEHLVRFYRDESLLVDEIAEFAGGALRLGDSAIVIATRPHLEAAARLLQAAVPQFEGGRTGGRYIALEAVQVLEEVSIDGSPDRERFRRVIGDVLTAARAAANREIPRIAVFGEMVALLWAENRRNAALRLEQLWNELAKTEDFALLCAYPIGAFGRAEDAAAFEAVCTEHSAVLPVEGSAELTAEGDFYREFARLQQKAEALEMEIAARMKLEEQLRAANDDLERRVEQRTQELLESEARRRDGQKLEAIGRLASGIAHDFNNLLTVINGNVEMLLNRLEYASAMREEAEEIRDATESAIALAGQLLAFGRKQTLQSKVQDLNDVIRGCHGLLRRAIGEDIALVLELQAELPPVLVDAVHMQQAIINLAVNARDAMPDGGRLTLRTTAGSLAAAAGRSDGEVGRRAAVLEMSDSGCGMPPEVRERIFEPFFTTKPVGKGTGLGLSMVHGVVKQFGGDIEVETMPGNGTTVRIYLPAAEATGSRAFHAQAASESQADDSGARAC
jgi:signal transduction histidine kinase